MAKPSLHEALVLIERHLGKRAGFRELREFSGSFEILFWEIVSGRPSGEVYHRDVYVAFSEADAEDCYEHILDGYEDWQLENWLWGPHLDKRKGNPAKVTIWNGFYQEPAPLWIKGMAHGGVPTGFPAIPVSIPVYK